jgi:NAD(P)H-dependent FMN reductase
MSYLIISSSLNLNSKSQILANELLQNLQTKTQDLEFLDLKDYPLPICDGDKSYNNSNVELLTNKINKANLIILASPIYNYDACASAKNLIELTGKAWENKTVAFLCAAGGHSSYMSIMSIANSLMLDFRCVIVPRFVYASAADFNGNQLINNDLKSRISKLSDEVIFFHDRLNLH